MASKFAAIIDARHASRLVGQQRLNHTPFKVGQMISAHGKPGSGGAACVKPQSVFGGMQVANVEADQKGGYSYQHTCHGKDRLLRVR